MGSPGGKEEPRGQGPKGGPLGLSRVSAGCSTARKRWRPLLLGTHHQGSCTGQGGEEKTEVLKCTQGPRQLSPRGS